jgi:hypothetical protein
MHSPVYLLGLLVALVSHSIAATAGSATVGLGIDNNGNKITWIAPDNPCSNSLLLTSADLNPCGIHFQLSDFADLHFEGCGGPVQLFQGGNLISNCGFSPSVFDCGFKQNFVCEFSVLEVASRFFKQGTFAVHAPGV